MKIVGLDTATLDQGDMDWGPMRALGDLELHPRSAPDEVVGRAQGAEAVLINKVVIDAKVMSALPSLKYIGVTATGTNVVAHGEAQKRGITIANNPQLLTVQFNQRLWEEAKVRTANPLALVDLIIVKTYFRSKV